MKHLAKGLVGWLGGGGARRLGCVELIQITPELTCKHGRKSCRTGNLFINILAKNLEISLCTIQFWGSVYFCVYTQLAEQPSYEMEQLLLYERQSQATEGFHTDDQSPPCLIYGCEGWVDVHLSAPKQIPPCINQPEPEFLTFQDLRHRFHVIHSLWEINLVVKLILGDIDSMWRNWRFQNCRRHMLCVGEGHYHWSNYMATVDRGWFDSWFKNLYFMGPSSYGELDYIFGSFSIPGIDVSSHNPSKNTGSELWISWSPSGGSIVLLFQQ